MPIAIVWLMSISVANWIINTNNTRGAAQIQVFKYTAILQFLIDQLPSTDIPPAVLFFWNPAVHPLIPISFLPPSFHPVLSPAWCLCIPSHAHEFWILPSPIQVFNNLLVQLIQVFGHHFHPHFINSCHLTFLHLLHCSPYLSRYTLP